MIKDRLESLSQLKDLTEYFITDPTIDPKLILKESGQDRQATAAYLTQVQAKLKSVSPWTGHQLETVLHQLQRELGLKPRPAFMTIRLAVTGRPATPPLFDTLEILGQKLVLSRLTYAQKILKS